MNEAAGSAPEFRPGSPNLPKLGVEIKSFIKSFPDANMAGFYVYRFELDDGSQVTIAYNEHIRGRTELPPEFIVNRKPADKSAKMEIHKWYEVSDAALQSSGSEERGNYQRISEWVRQAADKQKGEADG